MSEISSAGADVAREVAPGFAAARAVLKPKKARPFYGRHPWVLDTAIARLEGEVVDGDPWDAQTLEWATSSPPPAGEDFTEWVGEVASPEPLLDRKEERASTEVTP